MTNYNLEQIATFMESFGRLVVAQRICNEYWYGVHSNTSEISRIKANESIYKFQEELKRYREIVPVSIHRAMERKFPETFEGIFSMIQSIEAHIEREKKKYGFAK